jgi:release factor glutamine methyltransferase
MALGSIGDARRWATHLLARNGVPEPDRDSEVLLRSALRMDRVSFLLSGQSPLPPGPAELFRGWIFRRVKKEPVSHILERREFWGLDFRVTSDVLIPRPETELLVEQVLRRVRETKPGSGNGIDPGEIGPETGNPRLRILDLCTGSGCIAVSLARELPETHLWAVDIAPGALKVAGENAERHGVSGRIVFLRGDLFEPLKGMGPFDLIVSNPPYIPRGGLRSLPPEVRDFEPVIALDGGEDGLYFYRRIFAESSLHLKPGGCLILEIGHDQSDQIRRLIDGQPGMALQEILKDLAGIERVVTCIIR